MNKKKIVLVIFLIMVMVLMFASFSLIYLNNKTSVKIPILAYHDFMTPEDIAKYQPGKYTMSIEEFDKQLKYLYENGYHSIDYNELYKWLNGEIKLDEKSFMITIDDGNISSYHLAIPVIEKYNFSAIIFVITGRIKEVSDPYDASTLSFLGEDLITDIKKNHKNITLGSHSRYLHAAIDGKNPMDVLSCEKILDDLSVSKKTIKTDVFAYPFGMYNDKYLKAVDKAKFKMAFTFKPSGFCSQKTDLYQIPRININSEIPFETFKDIITLQTY